MSRQLSVEFDVGTGVTVKALSVQGTVISFQVDVTDVLMYRVVYWINGERKTEWMYPWELTK